MPINSAYKTWMGDNPSIHHTVLRNICLPGTHDSGTYELSDTMTKGLTKAAETVISQLQSIADKIDSIGLTRIGPLHLSPFDWVFDAALPAIKGLLQTTDRNITTQLNHGIRLLDFRILHKNNKFYVVHGLVAVEMSQVLTQIKDFLSSTRGEILYITMGHFQGFHKNQTIFKKFNTMVKTALGFYAYVREGHPISNNPFEQTYHNIINQTTPGKSRIILVNGNDYATDHVFWPIEYDTTAETRKMSVIMGKYSDTDKVSTLITDQTRQLAIAKTENLPFALTMTLTPQEQTFKNIVISSVYCSIVELARILPEANTQLLEIAAEISVYNKTLLSRTLKQLAQNLNSDLRNIMQRMQPADTEINNISRLYTDFHSDSSVVDLAIAYSKATIKPVSTPY